jgi:transcriptional regulator
MYIPKHFEEADNERLGQLIEDYGFGLLVTVNESRPYCSHLPFLFEGDRLLCHLAKANPQVQQLKASEEVLAVFSGPHAYVSPSWYETSGVPTWNYAAVHVYGKPTTIKDERRLQALVDSLTARNEANESEPWEPSYDASMLNGIVGFEIAISEIQGKFKMSQNRSPNDRVNVVEQLDAKGSDLSVETAKYMRNLSKK